MVNGIVLGSSPHRRAGLHRARRRGSPADAGGRIPGDQRRGGDRQSAPGRYHTRRKAVPSTDRAGIQLIGWSPREQVMGGPVGLPYDGQPLGPREAVKQLRSAIPGRGPIDDWTWVLVRSRTTTDSCASTRSSK